MKKKFYSFLISSISVGLLAFLAACSNLQKTQEQHQQVQPQPQDQETNKVDHQEVKEKLIIKPMVAYQQLSNQVSNFISNHLKELKYEFYRDQLNNILNQTTYQLITKQYTDLDTFYLNQKQALEAAFNDAKVNYNNAVDPNLTLSDLTIKEGVKDDDTLASRYFNHTLDNIPINQEAKDFMALLAKDEIKDYYSKKEDQNKKQQILQKTKEIISGAKTNKEKIRKIYDWIHNNLKYAYNGDMTAAIDPVHALEIKTAVCGGFSNLYKAMLDSIDIKNVAVIGWSKYGAHQWNIIYDEETKQFFHSDPTWGNDEYFSPTVANLSKDHRATKILDAYHKVGDFEYEYDRGFTVHKYLKDKDNSLVEPPLLVNNKHKVVGISQSALASIQHLYVNDYIKRIDYSGGTYNIKSFTVSNNNKFFNSYDGVLYSKDMTTLLVVPYQYEKESIILPKSVRTIQDWKSSLDAANLKTINIEPGNFWYASYGGILYDNNFNKIIYVPKQTNPIVVVNSNTKLEANDFSFNPNIKEIIISEKISFIPDYFLNNLANLELVHLPSSLTKISKFAFSQVNSSKLIFKITDQIDPNILKFLNDNKYKVIKTKNK